MSEFQLVRIATTCALGIVLGACGSSTEPPQDPHPASTPGSLKILRDGSGRGRVESIPHAIECAPDCEAFFESPTTLTLIATAEADSRFAGWGSPCTGTDPSCTVVVDRALTVSARFESTGIGSVEGVWLRGDLHVHDDHSADGSLLRQLADDKAPGNLSVSDQIGFAERAGLDFLPLTDHRSYDQHYDPEWSSAALLLIPGEEANGSPHATVHGAVDTIVQGSGGDDSLQRLQQSIWDAHAQAAVWITAHPDDGELNDDGTPNRHADAVGVDLVETWNKASNIELEIAYAENRWNAGYRFGIAGASDNHFRELWAIAGPGKPVTEALTRDRSERSLLQALRAGRTTLHTDDGTPAVVLEGDFDGFGRHAALGGDEVFVPAGTPGRLRITVRDAMGTRVRVLQGGAATDAGSTLLAEFEPGLLERQAQYLVDIATPDAPTWYRVEVRGAALPATVDTNDPANIVLDLFEIPDQVRALTSPIFVSTAPVDPLPDPLPADAGGDDGAEPVLGDVGRFAGFPDIAIGDGVVHAVAEQHGPGATVVVYRRRDAKGRWQPATVLNQSRYARFPRIAARGAHVVVVWQDERAGQQPRRPAIHLRESHDGGRTWQPETALRALDGRAEHPDVALGSDGIATVTWQEIRAGQPFDVFVQALGLDSAAVNVSGAGKAVNAAGSFDTRSARYPASVWPRLAVADDGRVAVVWQDNRDDPDPLWTGSADTGEGTDPDDWQIHLRVRASGGEWSAATILGANDAADRHPHAAFDAAGNLVVAWDSKALRSSGADLAALASHADAALTRFSAPAPIDLGSAGQGQYPQLAADPDGRVRAVWYDSRAADWRWRVMTAVFDGERWSDAQLIPGPGNNTWPALARGQVLFASTRDAVRPQRDPTQRIYWIDALPQTRFAPIALNAAKRGSAPADAPDDCPHHRHRNAASVIPLRPR
ncbi:MAG: CehA/McbA family metallohydrolase [Nevskiales bacterium]|nr:CehA/McbA family metallohydrolase [Nevskiales bacterium]